MLQLKGQGFSCWNNQQSLRVLEEYPLEKMLGLMYLELECTLTIKMYMLLACNHVASEAICNHFQLRVIAQNILHLVRLSCIVDRQNIIS